ncbi:MAG: HAD family phosphatase [Firmicutes bacterium]|nr:HAD family phosphatase [Bacillota bacterium]
MIKLIAMDLDGTLLNDEKQIPQVNKDAIQEAREKGIYIVLCSGRSAQSMERLINELELNVPGQYYITSNGARIMEGGKNEPMHSCSIPKGAAHELIQIAREHGDLVNCHVYVDDIVYVERFLPQTQRYVQLSGTHCEVVESLNAYENEDQPKVLFNNLGTSEQLVEFQNSLQENLPEKIQMFRSSNSLLEFVHEDAGKWNAVAYLAEYLNIQNNQILCMGDNENDMSMVAGAGIGGVPSNAVESLKAAADYISPLNNNEGAVAEIIRHFCE